MSKSEKMNLKRRQLGAFAMILTIIFTIIIYFVIPRIYYPWGISNGYITKAGEEYIIPQDRLEIILNDLQGSFKHNDPDLFLWFDDSFSMTFSDQNGQQISKLKIAKDGSPNFSIAGELYYLKGKERARKIIDEIIQSE